MSYCPPCPPVETPSLTLVLTAFRQRDQRCSTRRALEQAEDQYRARRWKSSKDCQWRPEGIDQLHGYRVCEPPVQSRDEDEEDRIALLGHVSHSGNLKVRGQRHKRDIHSDCCTCGNPSTVTRVETLGHHMHVCHHPTRNLCRPPQQPGSISSTSPFVLYPRFF